MTDDQLNAIEARTEAYDIPALIAEVRLLRGHAESVSNAFAEWESARTFRNDINSHEWLAFVDAMERLNDESEGA